MSAPIAGTLAACLLAVACGAPYSPAPALPADPRWTALDRDLPPLLAEHRVASVSIARIEHSAIVWTAAYGAQSPGVPATPNTLYNMASLTKPISSEVVLRLVANGRVALDEPMSAYWVDPDVASDDRHQRLTPRLALSHQTGFANWRRMTGGVLTFQRGPGEAFGYSGEGFEYVARFVEHKTGTSFEALAQQLVLAPAEMTSTAYTRRPWFAGRVATPTDETGKALTPSFARTFVASDLLYTTASDYARFLLAVIRHDGISAELADERARVQVSLRDKTCTPNIAPVCPDEIGIGLAWEVLRFGDQSLLMHTGKDDGVFTFAYVNLSTHSGTVILTSSDNGGRLIVPILDLLGADPAFVAFLRKTA